MSYAGTFSLTVLGARKVGKTALVDRFLTNQFEPHHPEPYVTDKDIEMDGKTCRLCIHDDQGMPYHSRRDSFIRFGQGFLLIFSMDDRKSFEELVQINQAIKTVKSHMKSRSQREKDYPMILVGHKCDLEETENSVVISEAEAFAQQLDIPFIMTSAKTGVGVDQVFNDMARDIRKFNNKESEKLRAILGYCSVS